VGILGLGGSGAHPRNPKPASPLFSGATKCADCIRFPTILMSRREVGLPSGGVLHHSPTIHARQAANEVEALTREWLSSRYPPTTCPHERSICYRIEHRDIARKLDRH
jgi:hypothetical protein